MDTVARNGGEEFTIVLGEVDSVASAEIVAKVLIQALSKPIEIEGHKIVLGASIGVAVYPDHGIGATELWRSRGRGHVLRKTRRRNGMRLQLQAITN